MRWSPLVSLFAVLAVTSIIESVFAAPLDVILEGRVTTRSQSAAGSRKLRSASLKKSHQKTAPTRGPKSSIFTNSAAGSKPLTAASLKTSTYRKAALQSSTFTKSAGGKVVKIRTPNVPPEGRDADHIVEAQTVASSLRKSGYKTIGSLGAGYRVVKKFLNHHSNLAFVDADVNRAKGKAHGDVISGKAPVIDSPTKNYMTAVKGMDITKAMVSDLKKVGVNSRIDKDHQDALKKIGIKRELSLEELDQLT